MKNYLLRKILFTNLLVNIKKFIFRHNNENELYFMGKIREEQEEVAEEILKLTDVNKKHQLEAVFDEYCDVIFHISVTKYLDHTLDLKYIEDVINDDGIFDINAVLMHCLSKETVRCLSKQDDIVWRLKEYEGKRK